MPPCPEVEKVVSPGGYLLARGAAGLGGSGAQRRLQERCCELAGWRLRRGRGTHSEKPAKGRGARMRGRSCGSGGGGGRGRAAPQRLRAYRRSVLFRVGPATQPPTSRLSGP